MATSRDEYDSDDSCSSSSSSTLDWEEERRLARIRLRREQSYLRRQAAEEMASLQEMNIERENIKQMRHMNAKALREASLDDVRRWDDSEEQTRYTHIDMTDCLH